MNALRFQVFSFRSLRLFSTSGRRQQHSFTNINELAKLDKFEAVKERIRASVKDPHEYINNLLKASDLRSKSLVFAEDIRQIVSLTKSDEDLEILVKALIKFSSQKSVIKVDSFCFGPEVMRLFYTMNKPTEALLLVKNPRLAQYFQHRVSIVLLADLLFKNTMYSSVIELYNHYKNLLRKNFPKVVLTYYFAACYKLNTPDTLKCAKEAWYSLLEESVTPTLRTRLIFAMILLNQDVCPLDVMKVDYSYFHSLRENIKCMILVKGKRYLDALNLLNQCTSPEYEKYFMMSEEALSFVEKEIRLSSDDNIVKFCSIKQMLMEKNLITNLPLETFLLGNMRMKDTERNFEGSEALS